MQARGRLIRLALGKLFWVSFIHANVKVELKSALINKGGTSLFAVKLMPPLICS
jgi:hypothetical protein